MTAIHQDRTGRARVLGQQHWPYWRRHEAVRARGGLVHPGTLSQLDRETFGSVRSLFRAGVQASLTSPWADRMAGLSLVFTDGAAPNALAIEDGDRRAIILQAGLIRRLWAMARLTVGSANFLTASFGTPAPERPVGRFVDAVTWQALYRPAGEYWPADRASFLYELFMYAADLVVHHELAHHVRGHIDLLRKTGHHEAIDEVLALSDADLDIPNRTIQLIELDADVQGLDLILHADLTRGLRDWSADQRSEHAFRLMLASILVFMVLDGDHKPVAAPARGRHPAPILRAMWFTHTVANTFTGQDLLTSEAAQEELEDAWGQAAEVAEAMGLPEGRWWGLGDLDDFTPQLAVYAEDAVRFSRMLDEANDREATEG